MRRPPPRQASAFMRVATNSNIISTDRRESNPSSVVPRVSATQRVNILLNMDVDPRTQRGWLRAPPSRDGLDLLCQEVVLGADTEAGIRSDVHDAQGRLRTGAAADIAFGYYRFGVQRPVAYHQRSGHVVVPAVFRDVEVLCVDL